VRIRHFRHFPVPVHKQAAEALANAFGGVVAESLAGDQIALQSFISCIRVDLHIYNNHAAGG